MKLKSYKLLFRFFSFLSDRTNGKPLFVKYKLLIGTIILSLIGTSGKAQKKEGIKDTESTQPKTERITCYKPYIPQNREVQVKAKIVDNEDEPIIGATILIKGTKNGTVSGTEGAFSLKANLNDTFIVSYLGMKTKEISVKNIFSKKISKIQLEEDDNILCYEVVVISTNLMKDDIYNSPPKTIKYKYDQLFIKPISPVGDLDDFQDWLEDNIIYSEQMRKDNLKGDVTLSFTVNKKGEIKNKKILSKLSKEADAEALRVLSSSEKWKPGYDKGKPVNTTIKVTINFNYE